MVKNYHTIILGGGPSGISAAILLQKAGLPVCVIDRATFPRDKTCAGLVTLKTYNRIRHLMDEKDESQLASLFCDQTRKASVYDRNRRLCASETEIGYRLVRRRSFDFQLVEYYKQLGGTMLEGKRKYDIDFNSRIITLKDDCEPQLHYNYLIAADGAKSSVRRMFHLDIAHMGLSLETHIPKTECTFPTDEVRIAFGVVDGGYAWIFPSGNDVCIGIINTFDTKFDYRQSLLDYMTSLGLDASRYEIRGAYIPYGGVTDTRSLPRNVLMVGDAGGFVDPLVGEGLYLALTSGTFAAECIIEGHPEKFLQRMKPHIRSIRQGRILRERFYSPRVLDYFYRHIPGREKFLRFFCDHHISTDLYPTTYLGLVRLLWGYKRINK